MSCLELLETRIAPAAVFKYTDVDGDLVTVKLGIGDNDDLVAALTFSSVEDLPRQLQRVNLENLEAPRQTLTVTATPQNGLGDGFANVGTISTSGSAYGTFTIDGDLGGVLGLPTSITKLVVGSLGVLGISTQLPGGMNSVVVAGPIGTLEVKRDLAASVSAQSIGTLKIGGSILGLGGNAGGIGGVSVGERLNAVSVGGALLGGTASISGSILADSFGSVTVGTMRGGSGDFSGGIYSEDGDIDKMIVKGDVIGGTAAGFAQQITAGGKIKSLRIDGSLIGSTGNYAGDPGDFGQVYATQGFGNVFIKHDIVGGNSNFSGSIVAGNDAEGTSPLDFNATAPLTTLFVGGSIRGGNADGSGTVWSDGTANAKIMGSIRGGIGDRSGQIDLDDAFTRQVLIGGDIVGGDGQDSGRFVGNADNEDLRATRLTIRGSIIGGFGENSGTVNSTQDGFANVLVGGRIVGGGGPESGGLSIDTESGSIAKVIVTGDVRGGGGADSGFASVDSAASFTLGGSVHAGSGPRSGSVEIDNVGRTLIKGSVFGGLNNAGHIHGGDDNGTLTLLGSLIGANGVARIVARGDQFFGTTITNPVAFTLIKIAGDVRNAEILAGYDFDVSGALVESSPDSQLGTVQVGGHWVQSSLVAGAANGGDNRFGNANDAAIIPTGVVLDAPEVRSRIGSVIIGGAILGIPGGTDSFGFVAQEIGAFRYGKNRLTLVTGTLDPTFAVASTSDVFVREIA